LSDPRTGGVESPAFQNADRSEDGNCFLDRRLVQPASQAFLVGLSVTDELRASRTGTSGRMSDGSINVQSSEIWGYEPQGSIEIAAPGALRTVAAKRKRRKNRPPSFCRLRRQTAPVLYVRQGQRDGKRDYKLSTETGQVQSRRASAVTCNSFLPSHLAFSFPRFAFPRLSALLGSGATGGGRATQNLR
jgi:hypothetical protein